MSSFSGISPLPEAAVLAVIKPFADCRLEFFIEQQNCELDGRTGGKSFRRGEGCSFAGRAARPQRSLAYAKLAVDFIRCELSFAFHSISNYIVRFNSVARVASPIRCHSVFSVFFHHLLNFRRHNIRRQQLEDVGRRRSFVHIPMLDGSSRDAVLADKCFLR